MHPHVFIRPSSSRPFQLSLLVKFGLYPSKCYTIDLQLETQSGTINNHFQGEIQIVKLHTSRRGQSRKHAPGHGVEVGRQCADVNQISGVGHRRFIGIAGDEVVGYDQGLTRAEVASIVKGNGSRWG